jgi:hypothetical protein
MLVVGILKWFQQVKQVPHDLTAGQILEKVYTNKNAYLVLYFLFQFGLFYWALRQQIRLGNTTAVQYAWKYCWPLFHTTNKYQYTKLSVIASYSEHFSHPAIKEVLDSRLCNLRGLAGHFIGTDMVCEKVKLHLLKSGDYIRHSRIHFVTVFCSCAQINLAAKTAVQKVTPGNITRTVLGLNFSQVVTDATMEHMRIDSGHTASKPPYREEISKIITKLNEHVGSTWTSIKSRHALRELEGNIISAEEYPWTKVNAAVAGFSKWMDEHSNMFDIDHTFQREAVQESLLD